MKKQLFFFPLILATWGTVTAQITITASDMPVLGDTLRYSNVNITSAGLNLSNTGANVDWDFSGWAAVSQGVDTFITPTAAGFTGLNTGVGYKIANEIDLSGQGLPMSLTNPHIFYQTLSGPDRYVATSFGAFLNGTPQAAYYIDQDEIYHFPLIYNRNETSTFRFEHAMSLGSILMKGDRVTVVDGHGTVKTPYFTTPVDVLRVRSEVWQTDSVKTVLGQNIRFERRYVEYVWLANGEHYPVVRVGTTVDGNGNETVNMVRYRDTKRDNLHVAAAAQERLFELKAWPNPAISGQLHLNVPAGWTNYTVELFDMQGRVVLSQLGMSVLDIASLAVGSYIVRVQSGNTAGYTQITR